MKKNIIAALACTALLMASCNTVTMTSDTLKVASDAQSVTVADLDVKPRKEKTEEWNFVPFNIGQPSLAQRKNNLIAEIVNEQGADILVEPLVSFEKKLFGKRTLTISGRPATFKDFRKPTTSDIAAFNALKPEPANRNVASAPQKEKEASPKLVASTKKKKSTHYEKGFRFGATVGMNLSTISDLEMGSKVGFNAGLRGEYNFNEDMYLGAALLYSHKGAKEDEVKANAGYIEVPIHFGYRMNFSDKVAAFGEVGPYFAFGVAGKWKDDGEDGGNFFGGVEDAKRFDAGLGLRAGVELSQKYQIHIGYDFGLVKLYDGDNSCRNGNFTLGVSYMF